jgi:uncharacterized membrane protein
MQAGSRNGRELGAKNWLAWLLGGLEVLLALVMTVWILSVPAVFDVYYSLLNVSPHRQDASRIVKWLSSTQRERTLNLALIEGQLGPKELKHYSDVRRVFGSLPGVVAALALLTAVLLAITRSSLQVLTAAQWRGFCLWLLLLVSLGGLALWDWTTFFAWAHQPLFGDRSWRLPKGAYSLTLFPASFWRTLTAAVLGSPALLLGLAAIGLAVWRRARASAEPGSPSGSL